MDASDEKRIADLEDEIRPLLDLWRASKVIGRILVIIGGLCVGAATIFSAVSNYWGHK